MKDINDFQKKIGYEFNDKELLKNALTHSSYANERGLSKTACNERLEFLGDAVLELTVSEYIYKLYKTMPEGEMTKLRAMTVCEQSLSEKAKQLSFGDYLLLGKGEEASGGKHRDSILADAFEAVLGAVFLDSGLERSSEYVAAILGGKIESGKKTTFDYKTELQEIIQKNSKEPLEYVIIKESGPDHDKLFISNVLHMGTVIGTGEGRTKKESEQHAASMALKKIL